MGSQNFDAVTGYHFYRFDIKQALPITQYITNITLVFSIWRATTKKKKSSPQYKSDPFTYVIKLTSESINTSIASFESICKSLIKVDFFFTSTTLDGAQRELRLGSQEQPRVLLLTPRSGVLLLPVLAAVVQHSCATLRHASPREFAGLVAWQ